MRKWILPLLAAASLCLLAGDGFGHGGVYRGPGDTVPPGEGAGPGTGGPNSGGPTTPGPGGPATPGPGGGPQTPGAGPAAPGGGGPGRGGPVTGGAFGGRKRRAGEGFEQWQFWWENNKDRYLDLRRRLGGEAIQSGGAAFLTGQGRKVAASTSQRPTAEEVNARIVPVLRSVLDEPDADIVDSAVLAIARSVRKEYASLVFDDIKKVLGSEYITARQSAILSLGVLGSVEAVPILVEIMNDTPEGRKYLGVRTSIQNLERAFAAVALGYIGSPETVDALMEVIQKEDNSQIDLRSMAILALGLFDERKEEIVQFLGGLLRDKSLDRTTAAQIPISLWRLGAEAEPLKLDLLKIAKSKKTNIRMEESCVIALGKLSHPEDEEVVDYLYDLIKEGKNQQARHFGFIALADIGGKAAKDPENYEEFLAELNKFLLRELTKPKTKTHQPWAGLALALLGREYPETHMDRVTIISKLQEAFEESNNPSYKSAFAIGLGLLNATATGEMLYETLLETHDLSLKGYLAVALGMMRYEEALPTLRKLVLDDRDPKLRLQVATGLGLQADRQALPTLLEALKNAKTLNVYSSLAKAIGLIGDKTAIDPLAEIVQDPKQTGLARAFACVALGLIGEKWDLPWNVRLSEGTNYRTVVPSLYEILDIL